MRPLFPVPFLTQKQPDNSVQLLKTGACVIANLFLAIILQVF